MSDNLNKLTEKQYQTMSDKRSGKSKIGRNCIMAFLYGGLICIIAQGYSDFLASKIGESVFGKLDEASVGALTVLFMVFLGSLLTALNVYDNIGSVAGAGSIVPITGFANSVVSPAMEYRSEGLILGVGAQMFQVAGPVLVYGTASSVLVGLIYFLIKKMRKNYL